MPCDSMRLAVLTVSPHTLYDIFFRSITPAITGPELIPMRQFILCPCHDGRFNAVNGAVISGPPPAPLPGLALTVEEDVVYVSEA